MAAKPPTEEVKKVEEYKVVKIAKHVSLDPDFDKDLTAAAKEVTDAQAKAKPEEKKEAPPKVVPQATKAEARVMFQTVFKRKGPEEVKDDEFNYFFNKIPKFEKDKEPVTFDELKKRFKEYAEEIHFTPTKAETEKDTLTKAQALFKTTQEEVKKKISEIKDPQASLMDFYFLTTQEDTLSDIKLVTKNGREYKTHKVILGSGSRYFMEIFRSLGAAVPNPLKVPEPAPLEKFESSDDDQVARILKYFYCNQNIESIQNELTIQNIFGLYAQAYTLKCDNLMKDLTKQIKKKFLNPANSPHFLGFGVKFDNETLRKACQEKLKNVFQDIKSPEVKKKDKDDEKKEKKEKSFEEDQLKLEEKREEIRTALNCLPPGVFAEVLQRDDLVLEHEFDLVEHISNFIKTRIEMTKAVDLPPEIAVRKDLWEMLLPEEKKKRTDDYTKKQKEKTDAKAKEIDALALSLHKLDPKKNAAEINTIILDNFIKEEQEAF